MNNQCLKVENNSLVMALIIDNKTYSSKIDLNDLKPWKERIELGQFKEEWVGLGKYFEKRIEEGYMPFTNPNDVNGVSIERALEVLKMSCLRTLKKLGYST